MIEIYRKKGYDLNCNDKIVNKILKLVEKNNGECPCDNDSEDKHCPCSNYRKKGKCCCGLYVKLPTEDTFENLGLGGIDYDIDF